ncbi:hypothetical protein BJ684DRAFT_14261 [Piptocephalis cylindrospora]|uniref:DOMON domain-containing protein n=1 Tax=Piptocephalis cylindrospora TaxID=1907219 RepID=A0A4P9Y8Y1_9FUNG|nr:hypothetical protein BJ684DRAFT_14261 [Piptocephalis cylindrospora]|eukprot:RKP15505.1 hypothetical protein BJ684DRAFT_14261 [Piptocephalis cylindrospora]
MVALLTPGLLTLISALTTLQTATAAVISEANPNGVGLVYQVAWLNATHFGASITYSELAHRGPWSIGFTFSSPDLRIVDYTGPGTIKLTNFGAGAHHLVVDHDDHINSTTFFNAQLPQGDSSPMAAFPKAWGMFLKDDVLPSDQANATIPAVDLSILSLNSGQTPTAPFGSFIRTRSASVGGSGTPVTNNAAPIAPSEEADDKKEGGLSGGPLVAVLTVGAVLAVGLAVAGFATVRRHRDRKAMDDAVIAPGAGGPQEKDDGHQPIDSSRSLSAPRKVAEGIVSPTVYRASDDENSRQVVPSTPSLVVDLAEPMTQEAFLEQYETHATQQPTYAVGYSAGEYEEQDLQAQQHYSGDHPDAAYQQHPYQEEYDLGMEMAHTVPSVDHHGQAEYMDNGEGVMVHDVQHEAMDMDMDRAYGSHSPSPMEYGVADSSSPSQIAAASGGQSGDYFLAEEVTPEEMASAEPLDHRYVDEAVYHQPQGHQDMYDAGIQGEEAEYIYDDDVAAAADHDHVQYEVEHDGQMVMMRDEVGRQAYAQDGEMDEEVQSSVPYNSVHIPSGNCGDEDDEVAQVQMAAQNRAINEPTSEELYLQAQDYVAFEAVEFDQMGSSQVDSTAAPANADASATDSNSGHQFI